ncbi:hemerythrin domain-containing protein [Poseidonibacter antarcticus]|uniref:hemerythrin domain-containing protein n=1 Tax=Poseidonibacter antarcticus TaxID=2478538 RepID=UPI0013CEE793|nr:hemerythrin domain-containing protein [Poseidonibacter antarcticus]
MLYHKDDIKRHKKEHQDFIDKVNGLYQKIKNDKSIKNNYGIEMMTELFNFLREWIVHHIMVTDKNLLLKNNKVV